MATGLLGVGETITLSFVWYDNVSAPNDAPLTTLLPVPTLAVTNPAGTVTTPALTQLLSTAYWEYAFTPNVVGLWKIQARCTDALVGEQYAEPIALFVTATSLSDVYDDLVTIGAGEVTVVSPVREVGGEQEIELVQGVTYSIANGNSIDVAFSGLPDTTGGAVTLTVTDAWGETITSTGNPFTGALGAWAAGAVTARFELTAAQTAAITASWSAALQKDYRFQVKITLAAAAGVAIPIPPKTGKLVIKTQAHA